MANCGDENKTHKEYTYNDTNGSMLWSGSGGCSDETTASTWSFYLSSHADDTVTPYDEIGDYKYIYLSSWFTDKPEDLLADYCSDNHEPTPVHVQFHIQNGPDDTYHQWDLVNPTPDSEESDETYDGLLTDIMSIVGGASGSPLVAAGSAAYSAFINPDYSDPIQVTENTFSDSDGTQRKEYNWEIDTEQDGLSSFPGDTCNTAGVNIKVDNNTAGSDNYGVLQAKCRWTFEYASYPSGHCPCSNGWATYLKTTDWNENEIEFSQ